MKKKLEELIHKAKITGTILFSGILLGITPPTTQAETQNNKITIQGTIKNNILNEKLGNATIRAEYAGIDTTIGTNENGEYSLELTTTSVNEQPPLPEQYWLSNNYPNPFNPTTNIQYTTPVNGTHSIEIYNILGQRIHRETLELDVGTHKFNIQGINNPGTYFLRVSNNEKTFTEKMIRLDGQGKNDVRISTQSLGNNPINALGKENDNYLRLTFTAKHHEEKDTLFIPENYHEINKTLPQTIYEIESSANITTKNQEDKALGNTSISLYNNDTNRLIKETNTDEQGQATINYEAPTVINQNEETIPLIEELRLEGSKQNHEPTTKTTPYEQHKNITLTLEEIIQNINSTVTGTITNQNGEPLNNAKATITKHPEADTLTTTTTNNQGQYHAEYELPENQLPQQLKIHYEKTGHTPRDTTITYQQHLNINTTLKEITNKTTATINGILKNEQTNENIPGASITLRNKDTGETLLSTNTNTAGEFNGEYQVNYHLEGQDTVYHVTTLELTLNKEKYEDKNIAKQFKLNKNIQETMTHEGTQHGFKITPYTATGKNVLEKTGEPITLRIKTLDGTIHEYTQSSDEKMNINLVDYSEAGTILLWHDHDSLADLIVMQHENQGWTEANPAQNRPTRFWAPGMPFDTLTTTLGTLTQPNIKNNLEIYIPEYYLEYYDYQSQTNKHLTFNGEILTTMLAGRGNRQGIITNWKAPHVPHIDRMIWTYRVDPNNPWDNSNPIPENKIQEMLDIAMEIDKHAITPTGRNRKPVNYHLIHEEQDSIVGEAQQRNWEYTSRSWRQIGPPGNGVRLDSNYRILEGNARYAEGAGIFAVGEEEFEKTLASGDAPNNQSSGAYTFKPKDNIVTPNHVGRTMIAVSTTVDTGTQFLNW